MKRKGEGRRREEEGWCQRNGKVKETSGDRIRERGDGKKGQDREGGGQMKKRESVVANGGGEKEQAGTEGRGRDGHSIGTSSMFILC